jgi:hypothetical protein
MFEDFNASPTIGDLKKQIKADPKTSTYAYSWPASTAARRCTTKP